MLLTKRCRTLLLLIKQKLIGVVLGWFLVEPKDRNAVLGPGLGLGLQPPVLVNITAKVA